MEVSHRKAHTVELTLPLIAKELGSEAMCYALGTGVGVGFRLDTLGKQRVLIYAMICLHCQKQSRHVVPPDLRYVRADIAHECLVAWIEGVEEYWRDECPHFRDLPDAGYIGLLHREGYAFIPGPQE